MGSSAVGGGGSVQVPIVNLSMGIQGLRDGVPGGAVEAGEGMREGGSSNDDEGSGEGSNEVEDGATNTQAESEETTNHNSPTELIQ